MKAVLHKEDGGNFLRPLDFYISSAKGNRNFICVKFLWDQLSVAALLLGLLVVESKILVKDCLCHRCAALTAVTLFHYDRDCDLRVVGWSIGDEGRVVVAAGRLRWT